MQLRPDASEALKIAVVAHDIERAFQNPKEYNKRSKFPFNDLNFLRPHEERGAEIVGNFLKGQKAGDDLILKVKELIARHEEGGNEDQNLVKDADSVSFLENNVERFLKRAVGEGGKKKVKEKFDWTFNRITSEKATGFALND